MTKALLWFRKDLRIEDNPALNAAYTAGCRQAIYITSPRQWHIHHDAPIKIDFIKRHLIKLDASLAAIGIKLTVLHSDDFKQQVNVLNAFCSQHMITQVYANEELEVNEQARDCAVKNSGTELIVFESDVMVSKGVLLNKQSHMFKVFTPFKKAWLNYAKHNTAALYPVTLPFEHAPLTPDLINTVHIESKSSDKDTTPDWNWDLDYPHVDSSLWPTSDTYKHDVLLSFIHNKAAHYHQNRDFPSLKGTSGLSPYLAIGAISSREVLAKLLTVNPNILNEPESGMFCWLNELIWRDFYRHLVHHFPKLSRDCNFNAKYDHLVWPNDPTLFEAWCTGKTGFPIIDAAMRQLLKTGWMHNRLRMITASFLTKHLLIDWRLGERFFMQHLIDGDLASNNGGWQWSASTGCDAQPYFRIFNPITQSKKFDPKGLFIRKYLPELSSLSDKEIHQPPEDKVLSHDYCLPIVDLGEARKQALSFYST